MPSMSQNLHGDSLINNCVFPKIPDVLGIRKLVTILQMTEIFELVGF